MTMSSALDAAPDLFAPTATLSPAAQIGFVLCDFDSVSIAIPQADVVTIEHGSELVAPLPDERAIGWFESAQGPWPAYALSARLELMQEPPLERSYLVFVRCEPWPLGILCNSVRIVSGREQFDIRSVPALMRDGTSLVCGVVRLGREQMALVCAAGALATYLTHRAESGAT